MHHHGHHGGDARRDLTLHARALPFSGVFTVVRLFPGSNAAGGLMDHHREKGLPDFQALKLRMIPVVNYKM